MSLHELFSDISFYMLFLTAIIALVFRKRFGDAPLGYLPYYLGYISLVEIIAVVIMYSPIKNTLWWYNIMLNGEVFFYFYLYYQLIANRKIKKILLIGIGLYVLYYIANFLFFKADWNVFQSFPLALGYMVVIFGAFWYLIELFQSDKVLEIHRYLIFWISLGLLFYLIVSMPLLMAYYYTDRRVFENKYFFVAIGITQYSANITMYILYLIGILWKKKLL